MPSSSSGLGRCPLKAEIRGSNPLEGGHRSSPIKSNRYNSGILYPRQELETHLRDLIVRSLGGDKIAYQKFLSRVALMTRGFIANSMGVHQRTDEKIEDLVQEVLITIHRKKHLYRTDMPVLPWLFAIAKYRLIDHFRSEKRRPLLTEWDETLDPADPNPQMFQDERLFELEQILEGLSERQKTILVLAKANGTPLAEIAERFGMSLSAVKVTVHRALQKARKNSAKRTL